MDNERLTPQPADTTDTPSANDFALWLGQAGLPTEQATLVLFQSLYHELRTMARGRMRHERPDHTLSATALTHEAFLRLSTQHSVQWKNHAHFLATASTMMRRILIDHVLARQAAKRDAVYVTLSAAENMASDEAPDAVAALDLHRALAEFEKHHDRAARVVEMRYFGGMELEEIAQALETSLATIKRDWTFARAWLKRRLAESQ